MASLRMDTAGFSSGIENAGHLAEGFRDKMLEVGGAIGIAFSAERVAEGIHGAIEGVAGIVHESEKLGVGVEWLSAMKHEATMMHVEFGSLESGLTRMQKNLADIAMGGGKEAAAALGLMHIKIEDIIDLGADKQFATIADGIAAMKNPTDQAMAAMHLFGKGGADLLNILKGGSEGMEQAAHDAERLGVSINEVEAAKLLEADAAMKEISETVQGLYIKIAEKLTPSIKEAAGELGHMLDKDAKPRTDKEREFAAIPDQDKWEPLGKGMGGIGIKPGGLIDILRHGLIGDQSERELAELAKPNPELGKLLEHVANVESGAEKAGSSMHDAGNKGGESLALAAAQAEKLQAEFDAMTAEGNQLTTALQTPFEKAFDQMERAQQLWEGGFIDDNTLAASVGKLGEEIDKTRERQLRPAIEEMNRLGDAGATMFDKVRTPLEKFQDDLSNVIDLFEDYAIDAETAGRAVGEAMEERDKARRPRAAGRGGSRIWKGAGRRHQAKGPPTETEMNRPVGTNMDAPQRPVRLDAMTPLNLSNVDPIWRAEFSEQIEAGDAYALGLVSSENALLIVDDNVVAFKERAILEPAVAYALVQTGTNHHAVSVRRIDALLRACDRERLLGSSDRLPPGDSFKVFRGVAGSGAARRVRGFSWTGSLDVACWFAARYPALGDPAVVTARLQTTDVYLYSDERYEDEFVGRPRSCRRVDIGIEEILARQQRETERRFNRQFVEKHSFKPGGLYTVKDLLEVCEFDGLAVADIEAARIASTLTCEIVIDKQPRYRAEAVQKFLENWGVSRGGAAK